MALLLSEDPELLDRVKNNDRISPNALVQLIRRSYPELWRQIVSQLVRRTEVIHVEPGDTILVHEDECVVSGTPVVRRQRRSRDEDQEEPRAHGHNGKPQRVDDTTAAPDATVEPEEHEHSWEIHTKVHGIVALERHARPFTISDRPGQIEIVTFEPLAVPTKEIALKLASDALRYEIIEAFATRCIPVALNAFFNVRMFLSAPDAMLLARPELHGTDRLQEHLRNPRQFDSEHLLPHYKDTNRAAYQFFETLRDQAFASEERCSESSLEQLSRNLKLEILTALAVPQIYGTICSELRMQFMYVQPSIVVGATIVSASAALQRIWDPNVQLMTLARALAHGVALPL
jgi:hypothetical protein